MIFLRVIRYYLLQYLSCLCRRTLDFINLYKTSKTHQLSAKTNIPWYTANQRKSSQKEFSRQRYLSRRYNLSAASISCNRHGPVLLLSVCPSVCVFWTGTALSTQFGYGPRRLDEDGELLSQERLEEICILESCVSWVGYSGYVMASEGCFA